MAEKLCRITLDETFIEAGKKTQPKVLEIYDFASKGMLHKTFDQVFTAMVGKTFLGAIQHIQQNKRVQNAAGTYVNSADIVDINELDNIFDPETGRTMQEITDGIEAPVFIQKWKAKCAGKIKNKVQKADPSLHSSAAGSSTPTDNPFAA
jgi:hypothetical protein